VRFVYVLEETLFFENFGPPSTSWNRSNCTFSL